MAIWQRLRRPTAALLFALLATLALGVRPAAGASTPPAALVPIAALQVADPGSPAADEPVAWQWLETAHFRLAYHPAHQPQAAWYADFVERLYVDLADLFDVSLRQPAVVYLYPTETEYVRANPAAAASRHVLAHARPGEYEIGMALTRLAGLDGAQQVDAFRHELTHLVLTERSGGRLPAGWHEGLAQAVERDPRLRAASATGLRRLSDERQVLPWSAFEDPAQFYARADVAYPQAHAVVAFLADRYGFGRFLAFLDALREGRDVPQSLEAAFGHPASDLEAEWRAALPTLRRQAELPDPLAAADLTPAVRALDARAYDEAITAAERGVGFWSDLGRADRAGEATALAERAGTLRTAQTRIDEASRLLAHRQYDAALEALAAASATSDDRLSAAAGRLRDQAERGREGQSRLSQARADLAGLRFGEAESQAQAAESLLAGLDDDAVHDAVALRAEAQAQRQRLGLGLGGAGGAVALLLAVFGWRRARTRSGPSVRPAREERAAL